MHTVQRWFSRQNTDVSVFWRVFYFRELVLCKVDLYRIQQILTDSYVRGPIRFMRIYNVKQRNIPKRWFWEGFVQKDA